MASNPNRTREQEVIDRDFLGILENQLGGVGEHRYEARKVAQQLTAEHNPDSDVRPPTSPDYAVVGIQNVEGKVVGAIDVALDLSRSATTPGYEAPTQPQPQRRRWLSALIDAGRATAETALPEARTFTLAVGRYTLAAANQAAGFAADSQADLASRFAAHELRRKRALLARQPAATQRVHERTTLDPDARYFESNALDNKIDRVQTRANIAGDIARSLIRVASRRQIAANRILASV